MPLRSLHDAMKCSQQRKAGKGGHSGESARLFSVSKLVLGKRVAQQMTLLSVSILLPFDCISLYRRFSRAMSWGHFKAIWDMVCSLQIWWRCLGPPHAVDSSKFTLLYRSVQRGVIQIEAGANKTAKPSGLSFLPCLFSPPRSGLSLQRCKSTSTVQAERYEEFIAPSWFFPVPGGAEVLRHSHMFYKNNAYIFYRAFSCKVKCWVGRHAVFGKYPLLHLKAKNWAKDSTWWWMPLVAWNNGKAECRNKFLKIYHISCYP